MNDKQRRLIDYFNNLSDPIPIAPPTHEESVEESVTGPPQVPSPVKPTPDSVRKMLEKSLDTSEEGIEESITGAPPTETAFLLERPEPVEKPIPERVIEIAVSATEKALNDEEMDLEEQDVFEALVLPGKRPVIDVLKGGDLSAAPPDWEFLGAFYSRIQKDVLPAIGRIDVPDLPFPPYAGTGFFVGENVIMTNRHVARFFAEGVGAGKRFLRFQPDRSTFVHTRFEVGDTEESGTQGNSFQVEETLLVHPHWDMALLRVTPVGEAKLPRPLPLAKQAPPLLGGGGMHHVIVVGYPMLDSRNDVAEQMNIFRKVFGRKRLLPGYLNDFADVKTKWQTTLHAVTHDASTLGGNSGSAVIDLTTGTVLALHFGGVYLKANYGVPTWELARDTKVTDLIPFADFPGGASATGAPPWLVTWDGVKPMVPDEESVAGGGAADAGTASGMEITATGGNSGTTTEKNPPSLPVAPDWFERVSDADLVEAYRRDAKTTERLIRETLLPAEANDLLNDLRQSVAKPDNVSTEEGIFDFLTGAAKTDPTLPEIVFLHGIMGGHLAAQGALGGRIWLSPLAFLAGQVARKLMLADDGERDRIPSQLLTPDGHVRLAYEKAARKWRMRGFIVHEFAYDWRKPITNSADRLHHFIESLRLERPGKRFALVAHSMGGLVASLYASRHPEWSACITRAIFLGSPLRGSFAPVEALLGTYPVFPKIALADTQDDLADYVNMTCTLPGLIDMLPDPTIFPSAAPLYQRATWPDGSAPAQKWLDQSLQTKRLLATSPILETAQLIVSTEHPTISEVVITGGTLSAGRRNRRGDGTVPLRSAAASLPGMTVLAARNSHGELPREQAVIDAVEALLKSGRCDLSPLTEKDIKEDTPLEEAVTESIEEAVELSQDLRVRLDSGILTQRDVDFLLRADHTTLPGPAELPGGAV